MVLQPGWYSSTPEFQLMHDVCTTCIVRRGWRQPVKPTQPWSPTSTTAPPPRGAGASMAAENAYRATRPLRLPLLAVMPRYTTLTKLSLSAMPALTSKINAALQLTKSVDVTSSSVQSTTPTHGRRNPLAMWMLLWKVQRMPKKVQNLQINARALRKCVICGVTTSSRPANQAASGRGDVPPKGR